MWQECSMIASTVWRNDQKLLQKSNLANRQPCKAPIMSCIWFNHLVIERISQPFGRLWRWISLPSALHPITLRYRPRLILVLWDIILCLVDMQFHLWDMVVFLVCTCWSGHFALFSTCVFLFKSGFICSRYSTMKTCVRNWRLRRHPSRLFIQALQ